MNEAPREVFLNATTLLSGAWPSWLPELPADGSVLDGVWVVSPEVEHTNGILRARTKIFVETELALAIPGVDAISLLVAAQDGGTLIPLDVQLLPQLLIRIADVPLALRIRRDILKPVRKRPGANPGEAVVWEDDPAREFVEIAFAQVTLEINGDGDIALQTQLAIDLPPAMIGDTGVVIEARNVSIHLDATQSPPGQPAGWRGVHIGAARVYLPGELGSIVGNLELTDAYIGNGGFTGTITDTWTPPLEAELFGMAFTLERASVAFVQNALTESSLRGTIQLPFFDAPLAVDIALNLNGAFSVTLASADGLLTLRKENILELRVDSLGFAVEEGLFTAKLSGQLTPLLGPPGWPTFEVRELSIDSDGNVHIAGGWLNLREAVTLDFYGFQLEITKLGMGKAEGGGRWVGFSGGIKLVDGMQAGASVEGLRVTWYDDERAPGVSFEGIGVELEIPGTLSFKGAVSYRELQVGTESVHRFDGAIKLSLLALNLEIEATLAFGQASGPDGSYAFMAIYLGVELPAGIPLWSTGLALYGMAGLFAMSMEPDRHPDEPWYGVGPGEGWYKRPMIGVTDFRSKWVNRRGSLALGAGVTIGTLPDNGYTFNGRLLLVIAFPGPILMIEGKANLLKERASLGEDPMFRALAVLDFRAGSFLVGLDARYRIDDSGALIDISGGAEVFFSFSDPGSWHVYLGQKDPRERRIRAHVLSLFEANAYWMLDARSLAMGAWIGYDMTWEFGPLRVVFEAWIEGNVKVSWRPPHFHGDLWAHGKVELSLFGFGLGLGVDARLATDVFDPFHIRGEFTVTIGLPWPLPDFDVGITLEWGPQRDWPALPLPLQEIAVEHLKVTTSWPLARAAGLLAPNYDAGDGVRVTADPVFDLNAGPPAGAPVVPLDCRPHVTFSRAVHDDALVGTNVSTVTPSEERVGDPERNEGPVLVRYGLEEVVLDRWDETGTTWRTVARKAAADLGPNAAGVPELFGSWAPVPPMPDGGGSGAAQVKLWLWSKNPFDYTRHAGREWEDWFTDRYGNYPCVELPELQEVCFGFGNVGPDVVGAPLQIGTTYLGVWWMHPELPGLVLAWLGPDAVAIRPVPVLGGEPGFCLDAHPNRQGPLGDRNYLFLWIPTRPNRGVRIHCVDAEGVFAIARDQAGGWHSTAGGRPADPVVEFQADDVQLVVLFWNSRMCVTRICTLQGPGPEQMHEAEVVAQHTVDAVGRWYQTGTVLAPHTSYRVKIRTTINATGVAPLSGTRTLAQEEYAFFRTRGAPALADLSIPAGAPAPDEVALRNASGEFVLVDGTAAGAARVLDTELNDLRLYVRQTLPATIPLVREKPELPRPVYRGYDVGVEFNEDYVSLMYRRDGRDLALQLLDANDRPVRDAGGRLIVLNSHWAGTNQAQLDETESTWVTTVNRSTCAQIDVNRIPRDQTLAVAGFVLEPDFVYQVRLTPQLLHETFADDGLYSVGLVAQGPAGRLGRWVIEDAGANGPSQWEIAEAGVPPVRFVQQTSNHWGGEIDGSVPAKPGTTLLLADRTDLPATHQDQPGQWTDYRLAVLLRAADDDAIGLTFRRLSAVRYYRFSFDRERGYRRLVRMMDGFVTVLAEDDFVFRLDQDYEIIIEAIGADLAIYQDGVRVFHVQDASMDRGGIGLYCWAQDAGHFSDIRVDDFRPTARAAYRFAFTTSRYGNFAHQLHSYQDETWRYNFPPAAAALLAAAVPGAQLPSPDEARAWEAFETSPDLRTLFRSAAQSFEVTRLEQNGQAIAFLLRCPEPVDWWRATLRLEQTRAMVPAVTSPGAVKLTSVRRHDSVANQESVALILREAVNLTDWEISRRCLPDVLVPPKPRVCLLAEEFDTGDRGLLFEEDFGPNCLDRYEIVQDGTYFTPARWLVQGAAIVQTGNIYGGPLNRATLPKPGTMALTGSVDWTNVRVSARLRSDDNDSMGLVFRHLDAGHFYRFELNADLGYRRLVKNDGGTFSELWSVTAGFVVGRSYDLEIVACGRDLYGFVDHALVFHVQDDAIAQGRVGLYCWANQGFRAEALRVETIEADPLLWEPDFTDLAEFQIVDAARAIFGPSQWAVAFGGVAQTSNIHVLDLTTKFAATHLIGGSAAWADVQIHIRLTSVDNDAIGLLFRYRDHDNYYRFSMDAQRRYRRLMKIEAGVPSILWQDGVAYAAGVPHDLTVRAVGPQIEVWLDGQALASVRDEAFAQGRVGLYCWANNDARFSHLSVHDATTRVGRWEIHDQGTTAAPSRWRIRHRHLLQSSDIYGGSTSGAAPEKPGTFAVGGSAAWQDYRLMVRLRSDDDDAIGVVFRYQDERNHYRLSLDSQRHYRRLVRIVDGIVTVLWQDAGVYTVGDPFRLTVDAIGATLAGYHNDEPLFRVNDASHSRGRVGLYAWSNTGARFESVEVCEPPREAYALFRDRFGRGLRTEWTIVDEGNISAPSAWNIIDGQLSQTRNIHSLPIERAFPEKHGTYAVAGDPAWSDVVIQVRFESHDDDAVGVMFRYVDANNYYRLSFDRERHYRRLVRMAGGVATVLWEADAPYDLGRSYEVTISAVGSRLDAWLDGIPLFQAIDQSHGHGRMALYCWANLDCRFVSVRVYPASQLFTDFDLHETFPVLRTFRWRFLDEGDVALPSAWSVVRNRLTQTSAIRDSNAAARRGTLAIAGEADWRDCRISVTLRSTGGGALGLVFRRLDDNHYYRFALDRQSGSRTLVRRDGANWTVLWSDPAGGYVVDRTYIITVECTGTTVRGFLDGDRVFSVDDPAGPDSGGIALYTHANPGAEFHDVRVALSRWTPHYRFAREEPLPAGTRLRVFSGSPADPSAPQPLEEARYVASAFEAGSPRLGNGPVDLRLTGPDGAEHIRRFLPDALYTVRLFQILRKADGTACIVLPAAGLFLSGQYRMRFSYRRDGSAAARPGLQVLRERGETGAEEEWIDIPWTAVALPD